MKNATTNQHQAMNLDITLANLVSPITAAVEPFAPITASALTHCAHKGDIAGVLEMLNSCDSAIEMGIWDSKKASFAKGAVNAIRVLVEAIEA